MTEYNQKKCNVGSGRFAAVCFVLCAIFVSAQTCCAQTVWRTLDVNAVAVLSPRADFVATFVFGGYTGPQIWAFPSGRLVHTIPVDPYRLTYLSTTFSPDERVLAVGFNEDVIQIYDTRTWHIIKRLRFPLGNSAELKFSPDGKWFASKCQNETKVIVWSTKTWEQVGQFVPDYRGVRSFCFSDMSFLMPGEAEIWIMGTERVSRYTLSSGLVDTDIPARSDGRIIANVGDMDVAVANSDGTIDIFDSFKKLKLTLQDQCGRITSMDSSIQGGVLTVLSTDPPDPSRDNTGVVNTAQLGENQEPRHSYLRVWDIKTWK